MRFPLCVFLLFFSTKAVCQNQFTKPEFSGLQWLQGSWKGMAGTSPFYEAWRVVNDSLMVNLAIEIKNNDTVITESSALTLRNGNITLGQMPKGWRASRLFPNELVLKNDSLPYSNTIIWLHTRDDHWFTILEHPKSTVYYDMTRDPALDRKVTEWLARRQKKS